MRAKDLGDVFEVSFTLRDVLRAQAEFGVSLPKIAVLLGAESSRAVRFSWATGQIVPVTPQHPQEASIPFFAYVRRWGAKRLSNRRPDFQADFQALLPPGWERVEFELDGRVTLFAEHHRGGDALVVMRPIMEGTSGSGILMPQEEHMLDWDYAVAKIGSFFFVRDGGSWTSHWLIRWGCGPRPDCDDRLHGLPHIDGHAPMSEGFFKGLTPLWPGFLPVETVDKAVDFVIAWVNSIMRDARAAFEQDAYSRGVELESTAQMLQVAMDSMLEQWRD